MFVNYKQQPLFSLHGFRVNEPRKHSYTTSFIGFSFKHALDKQFLK